MKNPTKARKNANTLFQDGNRELDLRFDFLGADAQEILNLAAETLVIRFRVATKAKTAADYASWREKLKNVEWINETQEGKININVAQWLRPKPTQAPLLAQAFKDCRTIEESQKVKSQLLALSLPIAEIEKALNYHTFYVISIPE